MLRIADLLFVCTIKMENTATRLPHIAYAELFYAYLTAQP